MIKQVVHLFIIVCLQHALAQRVFAQASEFTLETQLRLQVQQFSRRELRVCHLPQLPRIQPRFQPTTRRVVTQQLVLSRWRMVPSRISTVQLPSKLPRQTLPRIMNPKYRLREPFEKPNSPYPEREHFRLSGSSSAPSEVLEPEMLRTRARRATSDLMPPPRLPPLKRTSLPQRVSDRTLREATPTLIEVLSRPPALPSIARQLP